MQRLCLEKYLSKPVKEETRMYIIRRTKRNPDEHVYIPELQELYRQGRVTRREFVRNATLLGMSVASASALLAACGGSEAPTATSAPEPTEKPAATTPPEPTATPVPAGPIRGGTLTHGSRVQGIEHPARFSWIDGDANITRFMIEYLTYVDEKNVARPALAESWEASDDLKTWTLNLRKNVKWSTGEPFGADDVVFSMKEWLNPDVGSSVLGLMSYLQPTGIEKKDDYTVVLHLDSPQLCVPEHLHHYPSAILDHRTFKGDWLENPVGTGAFSLEEWSVGERAVLKRRDGYWKMGTDGNALPYLDEIVVVDLGDDETAFISAMQSGQIDVFDPEVASVQALKGDPNIVFGAVATNATRVLRMRVDMEPWTDNRVRTALKLCQDKEKILSLAYFGEGITGPDCHISPAQPEFAPMEAMKKDTDKAKALLAEAGYSDGLDVTLTCASGGDMQSYAEVLKLDAEAAGFRIEINAVPSSSYWDVWTEVDLGITAWAHRALAIMVLPLAYVCDKEGTPVPWNETRWSDEEFDRLLTTAMGTLDVEERRKIMADIQRIQVERGSIGVPYWMNRWIAYSPKVKGMVAHPTRYNDNWVQVWKEA
jgi:peptide/nickel transport system substrate-binding protein